MRSVTSSQPWGLTVMALSKSEICSNPLLRGGPTCRRRSDSTPTTISTSSVTLRTFASTRPSSTLEANTSMSPLASRRPLTLSLVPVPSVANRQKCAAHTSSSPSTTPSAPRWDHSWGQRPSITQVVPSKVVHTTTS